MSNLRLLFWKPKRDDTVVVETLHRFLQFVADSLNDGILEQQENVDPLEFLQSAMETFLTLESEKRDK